MQNAQMPPGSLIGIGASVFMSAFKALTKGITKRIASANSLQMFLDWHNYFFPQEKVDNISTLNSIVAASTDNALQKLIAILCNEETISFIEQLITLEVLREFFSRSDSIDQNIISVIKQFIQIPEINFAILDTNVISNLMLTLFETILDTPDAKQLLSSLNIGKTIEAVRQNETAMVNLNRLCSKLSENLASLLNDDVFIVRTINAYKINHQISNLFTEINYVKTQATIQHLMRFIGSLIELADINGINHLEPILVLQVEFFNQFNSSKFLAEILKDEELHLIFYLELKALQNTAVYQRYKTQLPSLEAVFNEIEQKLLSGLNISELDNQGEEKVKEYATIKEIEQGSDELLVAPIITPYLDAQIRSCEQHEASFSSELSVAAKIPSDLSNKLSK